MQWEEKEITCMYKLYQTKWASQGASPPWSMHETSTREYNTQKFQVQERHYEPF